MLAMPDLTKNAALLLNTIRNHGDWIDRANLAEAVGKNRLNPHDIELLGRLIDSDLIEVDTVINGITEKFVYRSKD